VSALRTPSTAANTPASGLTGRQRPAYARLGVFGVGLIATAVAVFTVVAALTAPQDLGMVGGVLALLVVVAALAWRFGTWAKVLAIVICALSGVAMFWVVFGLSHPGSPADFMPGLLVPTGIVLGIVGNALAIKHRRQPATTATTTERRIMVGVTAVMLVAAAGSLTTFLTSRTTIDLPDNGVPVTMSAFEFPELVEARAGDQLVVRNSDAAVHDFTVPALGLGVTVLPASDGLIDLTDVTPGTYTVYCTLHSDQSEPDPEAAGMATTLVVTPS
jgi:plastocyanin